MSFLCNNHQQKNQNDVINYTLYIIILKSKFKFIFFSVRKKPPQQPNKNQLRCKFLLAKGRQGWVTQEKEMQSMGKQD